MLECSKLIMRMHLELRNAYINGYPTELLTEDTDEGFIRLRLLSSALFGTAEDP